METKSEKGNILIILTILVVASVAVLGYLYINNTGSIRNLIPSQKPQTSIPAPITQITADAQITITRTGFIPATITVKKGSQITWTNQDKLAHRVVSGLPNLDSEEPLNENDSFSYTFETTGTFTYQSKENPKFKGTVIVE